MKYVSGLILALMASSSFAFNCQLPPETPTYDCSKSFKAKSLADVNEYMTDYKVNSEGVARNLIIAFDIDTENLNISSPCVVKVQKQRTIKSSGNLCIYGKNGLYINL